MFDEPFGMVTIESLACGTPVIGLDSGATSEIIEHDETGIILAINNEPAIVSGLANAMLDITKLDRHACRKSFETRFTLDRMCQEHLQIYEDLAKPGRTVVTK